MAGKPVVAVRRLRSHGWVLIATADSKKRDHAKSLQFALTHFAP
jgi:hypothetical protein